MSLYAFEVPAVERTFHVPTLPKALCAGIIEPVIWTAVVGCSVAGNSLTKTASTDWGNAGAISTQQLASGDGYVEITVSETTTNRMFGLSNGNTSADYPDIDFALYLTPFSEGLVQVYEGGTLRGTFGAYVTGDKLRVAVEGGVVKYRRNGNLLYTSSLAPTYPLLVDTALYSQNATIMSAVMWPMARALPVFECPVVQRVFGG